MHPFSKTHLEMRYYEYYELIWIIWDHYRGEKRLDDDELVDNCVVCNHIAEWSIDLLWQKWNHGSFIPFAIFVNNLINTDMYDFHMAKASSKDLKELVLFCWGVSPDPRKASYIDENFIYRIKNFNI